MSVLMFYYRGQVSFTYNSIKDICNNESDKNIVERDLCLYSTHISVFRQGVETNLILNYSDS